MVVLAASVLTSARPVRAADVAPADEGTAAASQEDDDSKRKAMEAYRRGEDAYKQQKYEEALASFQEASSFFASPDFQYNIGRCYENLERYDDAVRSYEIYLRAKPDAADSGDVRERIGRLRGLLEARKSQDDGAASDPAPEAVPPEPVATEPVDEPAPPGRPFVITGAVLTGVGAALVLGGGIGFGVVAGNRSDALDAIQSGGNPDRATFADAQTVSDEGKRAEIGQIATAATGGAIAVAGVALLAVGLLKNKDARASGASSSALRLTPALNRRAAGLVLTGRF